jgi:hypothetical protein
MLAKHATGSLRGGFYEGLPTEGKIYLSDNSIAVYSGNRTVI